MALIPVVTSQKVDLFDCFLFVFFRRSRLEKHNSWKILVDRFFFFFFAKSGAFKVHGMCTFGWSWVLRLAAEHQRAFDDMCCTCVFDLRHPWHRSLSLSARFPRSVLFLPPAVPRFPPSPSAPPPILSDLPSHHADSHWPDAAPATPGHPAAAAERRWGWENIITLYTSRTSPCVIDTQRRWGGANALTSFRGDTCMKDVKVASVHVSFSVIKKLIKTAAWTSVDI